MNVKELKGKSELVQALMREFFAGSDWIAAFFESAHHGIEHAMDIRERALRFIEKLTDDERRALEQEGCVLDAEHSIDAATACVEIAALFHDCGRMNDQGEFRAEDQGQHHELGARRVRVFCQALGFSQAAEDMIANAVLTHDFQSGRLTPTLCPAQTMIGKIVASADQIGWFHPDSVHRTLKYNLDLGRPFLDQTVGIATRLAWQPNTRDIDAITVMLHQLYGPRGENRFGVQVAREIIADMREALRDNILTMAESFEVRDETQDLIEAFAKHIKEDAQT